MNEQAVAEPIEALTATPVPEPPPPPAPANVTLELVLAHGDAARLFKAPPLMAARAGRMRTTPLQLTWHDTPDGRLRAEHLALIAWQEAGRTVWRTQPVARDGRLDWPLGLATPDLAEANLAETDLIQIGQLQGQRRSVRLQGEGLVEASVIDGVLMVPPKDGVGRGRQIGRLFLTGTPGAVLALARALFSGRRLAVPAFGLAGEALDLAAALPAPVPPALHAELDVDAAFAQVVSQLAATIIHHVPGALEGAGPEPVHQMRVALRRLRSALSLFRRVASSPELDQARGRLRHLAQALGPARDWDVFLSGTGREVRKLLPGERAVARLDAAARRRRALSYAELARMIDTPDFQQTLLDLVELVVARPWQAPGDGERPPLAAFARQALDRQLRRVTAAGDDLSPLPPESLHAVRISCKRLRYAAEFFAPVAMPRGTGGRGPGKQVLRFLRRLAAVQERLGQLNDGTVAAALLADLGQRGFAAGVVHGYLAARGAGGRARAARSWKKFRRTEPFWT